MNAFEWNGQSEVPFEGLLLLVAAKAHAEIAVTETYAAATVAARVIPSAVESHVSFACVDREFYERRRRAAFVAEHKRKRRHRCDKSQRSVLSLVYLKRKAR